MCIGLDPWGHLLSITFQSGEWPQPQSLSMGLFILQWGMQLLVCDIRIAYDVDFRSTLFWPAWSTPHRLHMKYKFKRPKLSSRAIKRSYTMSPLALFPALPCSPPNCHTLHQIERCSILSCLPFLGSKATMVGCSWRQTHGWGGFVESLDLCT